MDVVAGGEMVDGDGGERHGGEGEVVCGWWCAEDVQEKDMRWMS